MSHTATSQPDGLERISHEVPRVYYPVADNTSSQHASPHLDAGDASSDIGGVGFGSEPQGAGQPMHGQDGLPNDASQLLREMLGLLKRQEERALKEAKAASLRQPFEHAAKTSLEGVTSGSLIAIFTAALDVALLSYVQDSLANDEITDNPPTSINLAVACFYTSMLLAVLGVAFYGLMAFKCYQDTLKFAKIARPSDTDHDPFAFYKKLHTVHIPRGFRWIYKKIDGHDTPMIIEKLGELVQSKGASRTEPTGDGPEADQPSTRLPELPYNPDCLTRTGRPSTPEDLQLEILDTRQIEDKTWESTIVAVSTYKFTLVSQTWPSLFTLIVGLLLLAWAKHPGLVAKISVTITGIFFADLVYIIFQDASYLHPRDLIGKTSIVIKLILFLTQLTLIIALLLIGGASILILCVFAAIACCIICLLGGSFYTLYFCVKHIRRFLLMLFLAGSSRKTSSDSPEGDNPTEGNTLALA